MFLCRKNRVPAAFLIGLGIGLLLQCVCGGAVTLILAAAAIVGGILLLKT